MDAIKANALVNILIEECRKYNLEFLGYEYRPPRGPNFTRMPSILDCKIGVGKHAKRYTIPVYAHSNPGEQALTIINDALKTLN